MKEILQNRTLALVNKKAGASWSFDEVRDSLDAAWLSLGEDIYYQFCSSPGDGHEKAKAAVTAGFNRVVVVGGDGTVNSVGSALIGTDVVLGVLPAGSGNGFARHFGIPLSPAKAARALANSDVKLIDVGKINGRPFFVTCSMAWDAAIVRSFEKMPIRGIVPYIFAGVYEFLEYEPHPMTVELDSGERIEVADALVLTIANLTQYGGGARIAMDAKPDDGYLELVIALRQDIPSLAVNIGRFFNGAIDRIPKVISRKFQSVRITRQVKAPVQVDGELCDEGEEIEIRVEREVLKTMVPRKEDVDD